MGYSGDSWTETALIGITAQAGAEVKFASLTETIDIDTGDKDFETRALLNGGRVVKWNPQTEATITLEAYPLDAGTDSGTTGKGFFDLVHAADTSQPVVVAATRARSKYRIAIMWIDSTSETSADVQVVTPTNRALRVVAADGYFVSAKPSFTDGILKFTIVYKVPPFDSSGSANVKVESISGSATATMTALASYNLEFAEDFGCEYVNGEVLMEPN